MNEDVGASSTSERLPRFNPMNSAAMSGERAGPV